MREIDCLRCGARMKYMFRENLQLGKTGWILGDLPNLFAGALCADIFVCPDCGTREALDSIGVSPEEQDSIIQTIHRCLRSE